MKRKKRVESVNANLNRRRIEFLKLCCLDAFTLYEFGKLGLMTGAQFAHFCITTADKADSRLLKQARAK